MAVRRSCSTYVLHLLLYVLVQDFLVHAVLALDLYSLSRLAFVLWPEIGGRKLEAAADFSMVDQLKHFGESNSMKSRSFFDIVIPIVLS